MKFGTGVILQLIQPHLKSDSDGAPWQMVAAVITNQRARARHQGKPDWTIYSFASIHIYIYYCLCNVLNLDSRINSRNSQSQNLKLYFLSIYDLCCPTNTSVVTTQTRQGICFPLPVSTHPSKQRIND